jgi:hypothetical protein
MTSLTLIPHALDVMVTGTRHWSSITPWQVQSLSNLIVWLDSYHVVRSWHHGGCTGVDALFHALVLGLTEDIPVIHPAKGVSDRWKQKGSIGFRREPAYTHTRNNTMVEETALTIVVPKQTEAQTSGGTWYTYERAMQSTNSVQMIWPGPLRSGPNYYRGVYDIYEHETWSYAMF